MKQINPKFILAAMVAGIGISACDRSETQKAERLGRSNGLSVLLTASDIMFQKLSTKQDLQRIFNQEARQVFAKDKQELAEAKDEEEGGRMVDVRACTLEEEIVINEHRRFVAYQAEVFGNYVYDVSKERLDELSLSFKSNDFADAFRGARDVPIYCTSRYSSLMVASYREQGQEAGVVNDFFVFEPLFFSLSRCDQLGALMHEEMHFMSPSFNHPTREQKASIVFRETEDDDIAYLFGDIVRHVICEKYIKSQLGSY